MSTFKQLENLALACKGETSETLTKVAYSLNLTECAIFCSLVEKHLKRRVMV